MISLCYHSAINTNHRDKEMSKQIAATIYKQISLMTRVSCGIRELLCGEDKNKIPYLQMRVGSSRKLLYIRVYYMPSDIYTVELIKVKKKPIFNIIQLEENEEVYCEQLSSVIYNLVNKNI